MGLEISICTCDFSNMNGEVIYLGKSIRVTLTSNELAWLVEKSGLMWYFSGPHLRTRWVKPLNFPEEVVSKRNLFILLGRECFHKPTFEVMLRGKSFGLNQVSNSAFQLSDFIKPGRFDNVVNAVKKVLQNSHFDQGVQNVAHHLCLWRLVIL